MTDLGTTTAAPPPTPTAVRPQPQVHRRRGLPTGRAVVGGFLVAAAALGIFTAYVAATAAPTTQWVVAATDLRIGDSLTPGDLDLVAIDLPAAQAERAFNAAEALVGAVVVAPLAAGELVQQSDVAVSGGAGLEQLSFAIDADRALLGVIKPGERVDVLATYGAGESAYTLVVVRDALVLDETSVDSGVGTAGSRRVFTLGIPDSAQALAVSHALNAGAVSLVRSTARQAEVQGPDRYQPLFDGLAPDQPGEPAEPAEGEQAG